MIVQFYSCADDVRTFPKTNMTSGVQKSGVTVDNKIATDLTVTITFEENVGYYNYASFDTGDGVARYFFVDRPTYNDGLFTYIFREDVLQTHATNVKKCKCVRDRSEQNNNVYISDNQQILKSQNRTQYKKFNAGFSNSSNYYLLINGTD